VIRGKEVTTLEGTAVEAQTKHSTQIDLIQSIEPTLKNELLEDLNVVVVIPAFNEERFIGSVVIKASHFARTVIVVDDGSSDATSQIANEAGAIVISHENNLGKGAALNTGFCAARQYNPQVVACMDGDGQHMPEEIEQLIRPIVLHRADIVIGSRYLEKTCTVPWHRVLGHRLFNFLTRLSSGVSVSDSQSGFRAFSPRAVEVISFCSQDFSAESEMQFIAQEHSLRVKEVSATIHYTDPPKRSVLVQGMQVLNGVLRLAGQHRPLVYFGTFGGIALLIGIGWGLWVFYIFRRTSQLAVGYALISVFCSMIGTILISTGFTLHSIRALLLNLLKRNNGEQFRTKNNSQ
jgi:glycosyltransferase involved in cell wall biosynthesis